MVGALPKPVKGEERLPVEPVPKPAKPVLLFAPPPIAPVVPNAGELPTVELVPKVDGIAVAKLEGFDTD